MHSRFIKRLWPVAFAMAIGITSLPDASVQAAPDPPPTALETAARRAVGEQHRVPRGQLEVLNQATARYPALDSEGVSFKVQDRRSGQIYTVLLGRDGQVWDPEAVAAQERTAYEARYGRLDAGLADRLRNVRDDEELEVVAWLRTDSGPTLQAVAGDELDVQQTEDYFAQRATARAAGIASMQSTLAPRLASWGGTAQYDEQHPVMHARVSARGVRAMSTWPELDRVYLAERPQPQLDIARQATGAAHVQITRGLDGAGVKVAVIESERAYVAPSHPHLPRLELDSQTPCTTPGDHATHVAGIVGSNKSGHLGIAPGVSLFVGGSCSRSSAELQAASTRASQAGASIFNLSWGSGNGGWPVGNDRFYDDLVYTSRRTVVAAAGNIYSQCPTEGQDHVMSPASAYNVIAVGDYNDTNTAALSDDFMSGSSACDDPKSVHGDREKPELAAPGSSILSLAHTSPWGTVSKSGTSMAAPMVAGAAALLMESNPALVRSPEAIKAILMASAIHNIEGSRRLSEFDGAGGMQAIGAEQLARQATPLRTHSRGTIICGSNGSVGNVKEFARVQLAANQRLRVAIAWSTDPDLTGYDLFTHGKPHADLDLTVHRVSNGQQVAASLSRDNTYEIVDFNAPASGEYSLRTSTTCPANAVIPFGRAIFGF